MKTFVGSLIAAASLAAVGCCTSQPGQPVNPFMNSTLPPAGTVQAPPPGSVVAPAPVVPPTVTPGPTGQYQPQSFQFQGSGVERHRRFDRHATSPQVAAAEPYDDTGGESPPDEPIIVLAAQTEGAAAPYGDAAGEAELTDELAPAPPPTTPTVVRVLSPPASSLALADSQPAAEAEPTSVYEAGVEQASFTESVVDETASAPAAEEVAVAVAEPPGRFSHADDYSLLEGRLEFSHKTKQWKLRYIPLDGQTDQYGGSVVLADGASMDGHKEGDFVVARGQLGNGSPQARSYAPPYVAASVVGQ